MSRIANAPVSLPSGVEVTLAGQLVKVKGSKGELEWNVQEDGAVKVAANEKSKNAVALAGTTRALINNMVTGVSAGFEKKLTIIGVGYRAQAQGQKLNLTLGFSHPVVYEVPAGIKVETPSNTEIVVTGEEIIGVIKMKDKKQARLRRAKKLRAKISRQAVSRLSVHRTAQHIYAQVIDETGSKVLAATSTLNASIKKEVKNTSNCEAAAAVGKEIAALAKKAGVEQVAFDRSGFRFHGRVKALAEAAREAGLKL